MRARGRLISFEGIDGSGKSTQQRLFCEWLTAQGYDVLSLREPGGTRVSEAIREILLDRDNQALTAEAELLLFIAARTQIVRELIRPALAAGKTVVMDRFLDSTVAYQGHGRGLATEWIESLNAYACEECVPDMTVYIDLDLDEARARLARRQEGQDRLDSESVAFMARTLQGFRHLAQQHPQRIYSFRSQETAAATQAAIREQIGRLLA